MKRLLIIGPIVGCLLALTLPASACSCLSGDPRDQYSQADAAIIGKFQIKKPVVGDEYRSIYVFEVQEEFKTDFGESVDVYSASNGAACGLEVGPGQVAGLFLYMIEGNWHSNLCSQTSPEEMREAASPLPEPDGQGPKRMIVGGSFGDARVMALDERSRTLGYGFGGNHDVQLLALCPGAEKLIEIWIDRQASKTQLSVRDVDSLEVDRTVELPTGDGRQVTVTSVSCRDPAASEVLAYGARLFVKRSGQIYAVEGESVTTAHNDLPGWYAAFDQTFAYLSGSGNLTRLRLTNGAQRTLAGGNGEFGLPHLSPNGRHLGAVEFGTYEPHRPTKVHVIELDTGKARKKRVMRSPNGGLVRWLRNRRIAFLGPDGSKVLNRRLGFVTHFGLWYSVNAAVDDGAIWGAAYGELIKVVPGAGPVKTVRELPSPVTNDLVVLP